MTTKDLVKLPIKQYQANRSYLMNLTFCVDVLDELVFVVLELADVLVSVVSEDDSVVSFSILLKSIPKVSAISSLVTTLVSLGIPQQHH